MSYWHTVEVMLLAVGACVTLVGGLACGCVGIVEDDPLVSFGGGALLVLAVLLGAGAATL